MGALSVGLKDPSWFASSAKTVFISSGTIPSQQIIQQPTLSVSRTVEKRTALIRIVILANVNVYYRKYLMITIGNGEYCPFGDPVNGC